MQAGNNFHNLMKENLDKFLKTGCIFSNVFLVPCVYWGRIKKIKMNKPLLAKPLIALIVS